jgi:hypothetical protein
MIVKEFPKKNIIRRWFRENYPCCPLFGKIPFHFLGRGSLVKNPFKERCLRIIEHARELWNVRHPLDMAPFSYSWPRPDEVSWYPKDELLTARGIFLHVLDIFGASQIFNPDMDPDQIKHSEILWHARDYGRSFGSTKEVEDYKMLAIFSIWLAYHCLKEVLSEEERADDPEILKKLLLAEAFLKEVENIQKTRLKDRFKKAAQKGGRASKKAKGFILACKHALKESPKKDSLSLWRFIRKNYSDTVEDFTIEYDEDVNKFYERSRDGRSRPISFRTFQRYISELKKNLTK